MWVRCSGWSRYGDRNSGFSPVCCKDKLECGLPPRTGRSRDHPRSRWKKPRPNNQPLDWTCAKVAKNFWSKMTAWPGVCHQVFGAHAATKGDPKQIQAKSRQLASLLALQVLATSGQLIPCPGKMLTVLHMTGLNFSQCQGMWTKHDKVHLFLDGNSRSSRAYFAENWYSSCVGVSFREGLFSGTTLVLARLILKWGAKPF